MLEGGIGRACVLRDRVTEDLPVYWTPLLCSNVSTIVGELFDSFPLRTLREKSPPRRSESGSTMKLAIRNYFNALRLGHLRLSAERTYNSNHSFAHCFESVDLSYRICYRKLRGHFQCRCEHSHEVIAETLAQARKPF